MPDLRQSDLHGEEILRLKARIYAAEPHKTFNQERRTDQQDDRQRHLSNYQQTTRAHPRNPAFPPS